MATGRNEIFNLDTWDFINGIEFVENAPLGCLSRSNRQILCIFQPPSLSKLLPFG